MGGEILQITWYIHHVIPVIISRDRPIYMFFVFHITWWSIIDNDVSRDQWLRVCVMTPRTDDVWLVGVIARVVKATNQRRGRKRSAAIGCRGVEFGHRVDPRYQHGTIYKAMVTTHMRRKQTIVRRDETNKKIRKRDKLYRIYRFFPIHPVWGPLGCCY